MEQSFKGTCVEKQAVSEEDLVQINALARRELGAEEVYTFAVRLCDNEVDRDLERFSDGALEQLKELFLGAPGIFDHQWSAKGQSARLYRTQVEMPPGVLTKDGRPYRFLKGWAYMVRTEKNAALIAEIDGGIKREVSVGCAVKQVLCSVCGQALDSCGHKKGRVYNGALCCGVLEEAADAFEWSFVAVPAQRQAGVVKHKHYSGPHGAEAPDDSLLLAQAAQEQEEKRYGGIKT